ncbi:hypothetical protein C8R45DRAFT_940802 [Mycena sanguinolenta]|nr:hypothetical protein C8R45DRAFT_940802 [Mycena sanguinolenta]
MAAERWWKFYLDFRMPPTTTPKPSTGPPQALIERINYLGRLLTHLPTTLPAGPTNAPYRFFLDEDWVIFAGFQERGARVQALIPFLKALVKQMNPGERETFEAGWMDKLVCGAKDLGQWRKNPIPNQKTPGARRARSWRN